MSSAGLLAAVVNICLSTGNDPVVCNHGQCPDAGAAGSGVIVECAPGCHAGTRNDICRSCFCESCSTPDGG